MLRDVYCLRMFQKGLNQLGTKRAEHVLNQTDLLLCRLVLTSTQI